MPTISGPSMPSKTIRNMIRERLIVPGRFLRVEMESGQGADGLDLKIKVFRIEEVDEADQWHARLAMDVEPRRNRFRQGDRLRILRPTVPLAQKERGLLAGALSKILAEEFDAFLRTLERLTETLKPAIKF